MSKVYANVMVKDEGIILPYIFKYWTSYPIDEWVFYDDNSNDNTQEVIKDYLGDKSKIFSTDDTNFSESRNRSTMLEYSKNQDADVVLSIDADELLSDSMLLSWDQIIEASTNFDIQFYWYNVVNDMHHIRQDPMYLENFRNFFIPLKKCGSFDMNQYKYHTPRLPPVDLNKIYTKDCGVIHLQAINKRFYALKQLWYKHYEYVTWGHSVDYINSRYDPVVNNLEFNEIDTPDNIINGIEFDAKIYDDIEKIKGYREYILQNYKSELVTFGEEYLNG